MPASVKERRWVTVLMGRHPVGAVLITPYAVFLAAVFAYPLGVANKHHSCPLSINLL